MRISTSSIYDTATARLNDLQASLDKTSQQIATGRRILTPADDPVAAARALDVTQSQTINTQYATNRENAASSLGLVDNTLAGVTSLLQDAKTLVVNGGNGSFTDSDRQSIALDLQSRLDQLLSLANTADGNGNYLFSGYQIGTQPFVQTATGAIYQGDTGQRLLQVDSSRQIAISDSGAAIFQGNGTDVFKTLTSVITALKQPVVTAADRTALSTALAAANTGIDNSLDNVLSVRSSVGSRLREIDAFDTIGSGKDLQYKQTLSTLQDLDYNAAVSKLTQQQTILQAAQKSFVSVSGLSLFTYL
ncbi:MAG: flagellar hook-associated protein FlgL [Burkholderiaceae bacterium]